MVKSKASHTHLIQTISKCDSNSLANQILHSSKCSLMSPNTSYKVKFVTFTDNITQYMCYLCSQNVPSCTMCPFTYTGTYLSSSLTVPQL